MVVTHIITMMIRFRFLICIHCKQENPVYPFLTSIERIFTINTTRYNIALIGHFLIWIAGKKGNPASALLIFVPVFW
jgi:hypothetical protein